MPDANSTLPLAVRKCTKCRDEKPTSEFYIHRSTGSPRLSSWCKDCSRQSTKSRYAAGYTPKKRLTRVAAPRHEYRLAKRLYDRAKDSAVTVRRKLEFSLTVQWVVEKLLEFSQANYCRMVLGDPFMPSLDRVDSRLGYTPGNTRVIWAIENFAKNRFTDEQVLEFCKRKLGLPHTVTSGDVTT